MVSTEIIGIWVKVTITGNYICQGNATFEPVAEGKDWIRSMHERH